MSEERLREEKLKEVLSDKDFCESLFKMRTSEERQTALKEKGVDVTVEEINEVRDIIVKLNAAGGIGPNGEIDEALVEEVAGGSILVVFGILLGIDIIAGCASELAKYC